MFRLLGRGSGGECLAFAGVAGPSGRVEPFCAVSGSVDVDADEDDVEDR